LPKGNEPILVGGKDIEHHKCLLHTEGYRLDSHGVVMCGCIAVILVISKASQ
jgi:hypothetical protein